MSKTIVITGASDGIGACAARELRHRGHRVIIVGRSPLKTSSIANEIGAESHVADFTVLAEVRQLAKQLDQTCERIDVLANNAGGVFGDRTKTIDGFEQTFQINHLSPFLLTTLLLQKLISGRASVIQTSSAGARLAGRLDMSDLEHEKDYRATLAYGTAKLMNILFTRELHRRYHAHGISAASFHPGTVATSFATGSKSVLRFLYNNPVARALMTSSQKGAEKLVWLAEGEPGKDWVANTYYEKSRPGRNNPQALDDSLALALWERSEALLATRA